MLLKIGLRFLYIPLKLSIHIENIRASYPCNKEETLDV
jgi:hypothetical protein